MKLRLKMTVFVITFQFLALLSAQAESSSAFTGSFKMGGLQVAKDGSRPVAVLGSNADFNFYKTYSFGVDLSYARSFHEFEYQAAKGVEDIVVYALDKALWKNNFHDITVSLRLSWMFPSSEASRIATMLGAGIQTLAFKKGFGGRTSVTYAFSATEYAYDYESFDIDGETVYNTRYRLVNRLTLSHDFTRHLHWDIGASVRHYSDYEDNRKFNLFGVMTGISYDVHKNASLELSLSSASMDYSGYTPWNGPAVADRLLGSKGVVIMVGTTLKI